ncbi:MAG: hypothetical protein H6868_00190 [Rhodospirillales bacterium]|nr:hypothetical protein [Rhodospirillales bacterium]
MKTDDGRALRQYFKRYTGIRPDKIDRAQRENPAVVDRLCQEIKPKFEQSMEFASMGVACAIFSLAANSSFLPFQPSFYQRSGVAMVGLSIAYYIYANTKGRQLLDSVLSRKKSDPAEPPLAPRP